MSESSRSSTIFVTVAGVVAAFVAVSMSVVAIGDAGDRTSPASATASAAPPKPQTASIVIQHVMRGCHAMMVNGSTVPTARATLRLTPGSTVRFTDDDVMPHRLVQLAGPAARVAGAAMSHMGAQSTITFPVAGTYRLRTIAGEDYAKGITTVGPDNTLRIKVLVAS